MASSLELAALMGPDPLHSVPDVHATSDWYRPEGSKDRPGRHNVAAVHVVHGRGGIQTRPDPARDRRVSPAAASRTTSTSHP